MSDPAQTERELAERISRVRHELAMLARRSESRIVDSSRERPCKWWPMTVKSAVDGMMFSPSGAWIFVAECLERNEHLEEILLRKPPGKRGYVMKVRVRLEHEIVYIKLELGAGKIIGRSFHYSQPDEDE